MRLLILKTNIETKNKVKKVQYTLNEHPAIIDWSIDLEDIDNVLRIEVDEELKEENIVEMIRRAGFYCEDL